MADSAACAHALAHARAHEHDGRLGLWLVFDHPLRFLSRPRDAALGLTGEPTTTNTTTPITTTTTSPTTTSTTIEITKHNYDGDPKHSLRTQEKSCSSDSRFRRTLSGTSGHRLLGTQRSQMVWVTA